MLGLAAMSAGAQEAAARRDARDRGRRASAAFFEEVFQRSLNDSPIFKAQLGIKDADYGKWNNFSDAEAQRQDALQQAGHRAPAFGIQGTTASLTR